MNNIDRLIEKKAKELREFDFLSRHTMIGEKDRFIYTAFDGNKGELKDHVRLRYLDSEQCNHYKIKDCDPPKFLNVKSINAPVNLNWKAPENPKINEGFRGLAVVPPAPLI